jgi:hypothetical protein
MSGKAAAAKVQTETLPKDCPSRVVLDHVAIEESIQKPGAVSSRKRSDEA